MMITQPLKFSGKHVYKDNQTSSEKPSGPFLNQKTLYAMNSQHNPRETNLCVYFGRS